MLIEAIAIGLFYGFFFFEWTGLVAGGLIAPGYFALAFDQPWSMALCLLTALATMAIIRLLSFVTLLYGRRRFIINVLVAFALQWSVGAMVMGTEMAQGRVEVVGYIIPGLLAHEMDRQGIGLTLLTLLFLSSLVLLSLRFLSWLRIF